MKGMLVQGEIERYKSIPVPLRATITIMDLNLIVKELGERKILEPEQVREFDRAASGFLNCFRTCCRVVEPGTFPYQYAHLLNLACEKPLKLMPLSLSVASFCPPSMLHLYLRTSFTACCILVSAIVVFSLMISLSSPT